MRVCMRHPNELNSHFVFTLSARGTKINVRSSLEFTQYSTSASRLYTRGIFSRTHTAQRQVGHIGVAPH